MTLPSILLGLLPGVALAGPTLLGIAFGADWILRVALGFDFAAVLLGGGACWLVQTAWIGGETGPSVGTAMATSLGIGLVGFGLVFGAVSAWFLYGHSD